jgi:hypothetical protein
MPDGCCGRDADAEAAPPPKVAAALPGVDAACEPPAADSALQSATAACTTRDRAAGVAARAAPAQRNRWTTGIIARTLGMSRCNAMSQRRSGSTRNGPRDAWGTISRLTGRGRAVVSVFQCRGSYRATLAFRALPLTV